MLRSILFFLACCCYGVFGSTPLTCEGFVSKSLSSFMDYSKISVEIVKDGAVKDTFPVAPNGHFVFPLYHSGGVVLRAAGAFGWKFSPTQISLDSTTCKAGHEILFEFQGLALQGKVELSKACKGKGKEQPDLSGITIVYGEKRTTTKTKKDGSFEFESVSPGNYSLGFFKTATAVYTLDGVEFKTTIESQFTETPIDVTHSMESTKLVKATINGFRDFRISWPDKLEYEMTQLHSNGNRINSRQVANEKGFIHFPSIPCGDTLLKTFDVNMVTKPAKHDFFVDGITVPNVAMLVVSRNFNGRVVVPAGDQNQGGHSGLIVRYEPVGTKAAGKQIQTVEVRTDGNYDVSLTEGDYRVTGTHKDFLLEESTITVSYTVETIPVVKVLKYSVCGSSSASPMTIEVYKKNSLVESVRIDKSDGVFCVFVPPGTYEFVPKGEPPLHPKSKQVKVTSLPVTKVYFSQIMVAVLGNVKCTKRCDAQVHLKTKGATLQTTTVDPKDNSFAFAGVTPGTYDVVLDTKVSSCWKSLQTTIEVVDKSPPNIVFEQEGFVVSVTSKIALDVLLQSAESGNTTPQKHSLKIGDNQLCVKSNGIHKVLPAEDCFQLPTDLTISSQSSGKLDIPEPLVSVKVVVELSQKSEDTSIVVTNKDVQLKVPPPTREGNRLTYTLLVPVGSNLLVKPIGTTTFFSPLEHTLKIEHCGGNQVTFEGTQGTFMEAKTDTPLQDVQISVWDSQGLLVKESATDSTGTAKIGPLQSAYKYKVTAVRAGYEVEIKSGLDQDGFYLAMGEKSLPVQIALKQLSAIVVKVTHNGAPLAQAFISISAIAGTAHRNHALTTETGVAEFVRVPSGKYFVRGMIKDYLLEPTSLEVVVEKGKVQEVVMTATRTAFSCSGTVRGISGQPEANTAVEVVNAEGVVVEDSVTDQSGVYRIQGLNSGTAYSVRVRVGKGHSYALPESRQILIQKADVDGKDFVAVPSFSNITIAGTVVIDDFLTDFVEVQLRAANGVVVDVSPVTLFKYFQFTLKGSVSIPQSWTVRVVKKGNANRLVGDYHEKSVEIKKHGQYEFVELAFNGSFLPESKIKSKQGGSNVLLLGLLVVMYVLRETIAKALYGFTTNPAKMMKFK